MSDPFLGELRLFALPFAPRGWAACDGQVLEIARNEALFSLIGTTFGGDGKATFALPDLRGRTPIGIDGGTADLSLGARGGAERVALTIADLAPHRHGLRAASDAPATVAPADAAFAPLAGGYTAAPASAIEIAGVLAEQGSGKAHDTMQPFAVLLVCVALGGLYPANG